MAHFQRKCCYDLLRLPHKILISLQVLCTLMKFHIWSGNGISYWKGGESYVWVQLFLYVVYSLLHRIRLCRPQYFVATLCLYICIKLLLLKDYSLSHDQVGLDIWLRCWSRYSMLIGQRQFNFWLLSVSLEVNYPVLTDHEEVEWPYSPTIFRKG